MAKNFKVLLGGTDCTNYLRKAEKITTYGDSIAKYVLEFTKNVNNLIPLSNALSVAIYEDSSVPPTTKVFDGFIDLFEPGAGLVKITAKDKLALLINNQVMHYYDKTIFGDPAYPDGKISDIFKDLVTTYGGLSTNSGATVQDSGTISVLEKFPCKNADIFERVRKLAETLNWVFYYRADTDFVYFEPKNFTVNATTLQVGVNVIEIPTWEYDRAEMINDLRLEGAQQLVQSSELFSGDASTTEFTLSDIPEDIAVYYSAAKNYGTTARLANEIKIGDFPNSLSVHDYEVDKKNKTITFTSFVPAASTNNILAEISYYAAIPIHMKDETSIMTYTSYKKTVTLIDVLSLSDAWKRAENILTKYSQPFKSAKLKVLWTNSLNVQVGQSIKVIDSVNVPPINQYFTVYKVTDSWPEASMDIEVGDKQYTIEEYQANIIERVKRLEETVIGTTDAVTEILQQTITFDCVPDTTNVLVQDIEDSFVLGHPDNGKLGLVL